MSDSPQADWDPISPDVLRDQRTAYDEMRRRCPVAYSDFMGWSLFRHADVMRVLLDHKTFSSVVSQHLSVPSGMDQPEHTAYRRLIEPYFSAQSMEAFGGTCRGIASKLVQGLRSETEVEFVERVALPFAVQVQCAFLGWPASLQEPLLRWMRKNHEATLAQDRKTMSGIALEFRAIIDDLLIARHQADAGPQTDTTSALIHEQVWDRPLSHEEVASILRNWTVGEIGTIAAAVGILAHYLAVHAELQNELRTRPDVLPAAIEEILRIHGPLLATRRIATRPVEIGGRRIRAAERITLMLIAANRDERAFEEPDSFRLDRDPTKNLLWGAGIHACPGAPLARLEMRVIMEELLSRTGEIGLAAGKTPTLAVYPASGFASLRLRVRPTTASGVPNQVEW